MYTINRRKQRCQRRSGDSSLRSGKLVRRESVVTCEDMGLSPDQSTNSRACARSESVRMDEIEIALSDDPRDTVKEPLVACIRVQRKITQIQFC
jgi:hypothetical protein